MTDAALELRVLYEDAEVVVVDKPSGMLVHAGWADDGPLAVEQAGALVGGRMFPVHRLDRATSGALIFARSVESARELGRAFMEGEVAKTYWALVRGVPPESGLVDHPIPKREGGPRVPARTRFERLGASTVERCSLVRAMPETGRLHQIRRHMKHLSHPLVGDVNYGQGPINRHFRATYDLHRLALHATELAFAHPITRAPLRVIAPLPPELVRTFRALGLPTDDAEVRSTGGGESC